jgi:hypothetical protein
VAPDEIDGQHGFARPRTPTDNGRMADLEILPHGVEQSLSANARHLGGNHYLAGDYLHEMISDLDNKIIYNLETQDKQGGLRTS